MREGKLSNYVQGCGHWSMNSVSEYNTSCSHNVSFSLTLEVFVINFMYSGRRLSVGLIYLSASFQKG